MLLLLLLLLSLICILSGKHRVDVGDSRSSVASIIAYMLCTCMVFFLSCSDEYMLLLLFLLSEHEFCHALRTSRHGGSEGWWWWCRGVILLRTSLGCCCCGGGGGGGEEEVNTRLFCSCNLDSRTSLASASRRALSH